MAFKEPLAALAGCIDEFAGKGQGDIGAAPSLPTVASSPFIGNLLPVSGGGGVRRFPVLLAGEP